MSDAVTRISMILVCAEALALIRLFRFLYKLTVRLQFLCFPRGY